MSQEIIVSDNAEKKQFNKGNTGEIIEITNPDGKKFLFKPAQDKSGNDKKYRASIQVAASKLQQIIRPDTKVTVSYATIDGRFGSIQEYIEGQDLNYEYSENDLKELLGEYVVDYLLCNYDSHSRNFVKTDAGKIYGVDKEQSFRYIEEPESLDLFMGTNFNEKYNEDPPVYESVITKAGFGYYGLDILDELKQYIDRIKSVSPEEYREIFSDYAIQKCNGDTAKANELLDKIVGRKEFFEQKFIEAYKTKEEMESKGEKYSPLEDENFLKKPKTEKLNVNKMYFFMGVNNSLEQRLAFRSINDFSGTDLKVIQLQESIPAIYINDNNSNKFILSFNSNSEIPEDVEQFLLNYVLAMKEDGNFTIDSTDSKEKLDIESYITAENLNTQDIKNSIKEIFPKASEDDIFDFEDNLLEWFNQEENEKQKLDVNSFKSILPYELVSNMDKIESSKIEEFITLLNSTVEKERTAEILHMHDIKSINGRAVLSTIDARNKLIEYTKREIDGNVVVDLNEFPPSLHDFLLRGIYEDMPQISQEQKSGLVFYKGRGFVPMNAFTREQYGIVEQDDFRITQISDCFLDIDALINQLPPRKYDMIINRMGSGNSQSLEEGSKNKYSSLVSFGTDKGTDIQNNSKARYHRILKRNEGAIPAELLVPSVISDHASENEMLVLPFEYVTGKVEEVAKNRFLSIKNVEMTDVKDVSLVDLVEENLNSYREYEKNRLLAYKDSSQILEENFHTIPNFSQKSPEFTQNLLQNYKSNMTQDQLSNMIMATHIFGKVNAQNRGYINNIDHWLKEMGVDEKSSFEEQLMQVVKTQGITSLDDQKRFCDYARLTYMGKIDPENIETEAGKQIFEMKDFIKSKPQAFFDYYSVDEPRILQNISDIDIAKQNVDLYKKESIKPKEEKTSDNPQSITQSDLIALAKTRRFSKINDTINGVKSFFANVLGKNKSDNKDKIGEEK